MTKAIEEKQRIEKWDIARGVLISLVVLGHLADYYTDDSVSMRGLYLFLYSFHIPCFLFLDGLFSKRTVNEKRYSRIFSYLIIYLFTKILITLVLGIINHEVSFDLFSEDGVPWYGLALFWCSLATIFLKRFPKQWVLCASVILACFIGYDNNISDFLVLSRSFVFFPFYFLGYCTDAQQLAEKLSSYFAKIYGVVIFVVLAILCFTATDSIYFIRGLLTGRNPFRVFSTTYEMDNLVPFGGLLRLLYYFIVLVIGLAFFAIIPTYVNKITKGIAAIGRRSLQIYILHRPIIYILYKGFSIQTALAGIGIHGIVIIPLAILIVIILGVPCLEKPIHAIIYPKCLTTHKNNEHQ